MIGIVCLEERRGMQFGGRRVSRDRVVTEKICELCEGKTLWMNPASEKLFAEQKESGKERTPMKARSAPEFKTYFNAIWKELNENA